MDDIAVEKLLLSEVKAFWVVFRQILESDFPGYSKETTQLFLEKYYSEANYRYFLEHSLKTILVAKFESQIIGFAVVDEPYGGVSLLRWLGIKKEFQKKGIGKRVIQSWLKLAVSQHCHKAEVASQPEARDFYRKTGLILEGHRVKSYFGIDQYIFGKVLI